MQFKTPFVAALVLPVLGSLILLTGCPAPRPGAQSPPAVAVPPGQGTGPQAPRLEGRPFDVVPGESLVSILVFRAGPLAKAGHNHVIASHDVTGAFYVPDDVLHSTFELHVPVAQLTIDEPTLRAKEGPDFPTDVPDSAKEGTRHNMLSEALLNAAQYPEFTLASARIQPGSMGSSVQADVEVTIRGQSHVVPVPVAYTLTGGELVATGELSLKQSDLGLTPFSALLGALQVQDEMHVKFHIVARASQTKIGS